MSDNAGITMGNITFGRGVTGPGGLMYCRTEGCQQVHDMYAIADNCEGYATCPSCGVVLKQLCRRCGMLWLSPTEFVRWTKEMDGESTRIYNDPKSPFSYKYLGRGRRRDTDELHAMIIEQFGARRFRIVETEG